MTQDPGIGLFAGGCPLGILPGHRCPRTTAARTRKGRWSRAEWGKMEIPPLCLAISPSALPFNESRSCAGYPDRPTDLPRPPHRRRERVPWCRSLRRHFCQRSGAAFPEVIASAPGPGLHRGITQAEAGMRFWRSTAHTNPHSSPDLITSSLILVRGRRSSRAGRPIGQRRGPGWRRCAGRRSRG